MERGFIKLNVAVLVIGDALTFADEPPAQIVIERFSTAGHILVAQSIVQDTLQGIRAKFLEFIADPGVDVVLALAGTKTEYGTAALAPLVTRPLVGFSDLFRYMTFEEIGTAAMLVDADAAQCKSTFVFLLPSSIGAVRTALDRLIIPQLDYRTKPANLVMRIPRIAHVESPEKLEPEPWITPKRTTSSGIVAVPAPPRPPPRGGTMPPPLPISVARRMDAVPGFVEKEITNVGPAPAPRQKVSTISAPLPTRLPATPAPMVEELEATPPKTREFEVVDKAGPIPKTPNPSVMVDEGLADTVPVKVATAAKVLPPPPVATAAVRSAFDDDDDMPRRGSYPRERSSNKFAVAWLGIALAAAAMIVVFLMLRKEQDPPIERGDVVAANRPTEPEPRYEPPPVAVEPPPVAVVVPPVPVMAIDAPHEIDMPVEPAGTKTIPVVAKVPKEPKVPKVPKDVKVPIEPKEPELAPVTAENGCDEVSCALDRYKQPCCAKFRPPEEAPKEPKPVSDVPEKIDREMIVEGINKVKPAVMQCGEVHATKGTVKLRVEVDAGGHVGNVSVSSTPDEQLGTCVATAIKKATFGKTQSGGSFGYPFVF